MGQNDNVYWGLFYQKCDFSTVEKARSILEFLSKQDALFVPARFDYYDPLRKPFDAENLAAPAEMLRGHNEKGGEISLRSTKFRFLMSISWTKRTTLDCWSINGSAKLFERQTRTDTLVQFIAQLAEKATCQYGALGLREDWRAKNFIVTPTSSVPCGLELQTGLLGVSWLTVLARLFPFSGAGATLKN